jgi:glucuronosyltransferase
MDQVSAYARDQMESPLDRAVYWIEYVIRNQGAPHLRIASRNLPLFQRYLFDVLFFVVFSALSFLFLVFYLCRHIICSNDQVKMNGQKKKTN